MLLDEDYYRNDYPDEDEAVADSEEEERVESGTFLYAFQLKILQHVN